MFVPFDKPPLSYQDQVIHLQNKGLVICDRNKAERFLMQVNYYRLRGYYIHLHDQATDVFVPNTTFDQLLDIYDFDTELRSLVGNQLLGIEVSMRTHLAYFLSHQYGGLGHTCVSNFVDAEKYYSFMTTVVSEVKKKANDAHIKHFISKYHGNIPIWCLVEILSMAHYLFF